MKSAVRRLVASAVLLLLASAGARPDRELVVWIEEPSGADPVSGTVEVVVGTDQPERIERIELFVDGAAVGELTAPPFRMPVDLGYENEEHHFLARAHGTRDEVVQAETRTPAIRVDEDLEVGLQELYVTVTDGERRILDLTAGDFEVWDEGYPQSITTFARGDVPLTAAILVDASSSMEGQRLDLALDGASTFLRGMRELDEATVMLFSDRLLHGTPLSSDPELLSSGLDTVRAEGGTALNDHLYLALRRLEVNPGRRVVVLLSDGVDVHSALPMRKVKWIADRSRALLYWIRSADLSDPRLLRYSAWRDPEAFREEYRLLTETVRDSGGRIFTVPRLEDTSSAVEEILRELREQYVLGYHPTTLRREGSWHSVRVEVSRRGARVRSRSGYVDY